MNQIIIRILSLLTIALLFGCSGISRPPVDSNADIVARVVSQPSYESMIAHAERAIDSIAMLPIDTLAESSDRRVPVLVKDISKALKEHGHIDAAAAVAAYPYGIDAMQNKEIAMRLLTLTLLPGTAAPAIEGLVSANKRSKYTIVLFHESACRTCQEIIWELKRRHKELQQAKVRIVTVSTDTNKDVWEEYATLLPWSDKLCDYRGFYNQNMMNFGVAAVPTIYLIDTKGLVVDQYMMIEEIMDKVLPNK